MSIWSMLAIFVLEAAAAALTVPFAASVARKLDIVAHPNPDVATHTKIVPLLGGGAILAAFVPVMVLTQRGDTRWNIAIVSALPLLLLAAYKDKFQTALSPAIQITVQAAAVLPFLFAGRVLRLSGASWLDGILTLLICLWVINGWNFLDVMDGLAGGVASIAAVMFAVGALRFGDSRLAFVALAFGGCMAGFLFHNLPPARIFLGDIGSFAVGLFFITCMLFTPPSVKATLGWGFLLFVPLFDVALTTVVRLRAGHSPVIGGNQHLSLRVLAKGWSNCKVNFAAYLLTAVCGTAGVYILG